MTEELDASIDREFKPSPKLETLYLVYFAAWFTLGILSWYIPILFFAPPAVTMGLLFPILALLVFTIYWIPRYCASLRYKLTGEEIVWERGVWFRNTGLVPYNRITNVDVSQGPLSRRLGLASIRIQTAGYSGQSAAEIKIVGVEEYAELRELIMGFVRGKGPMAVETYSKEDATARILGELVKIRALLEKRAERQ